MQEGSQHPVRKKIGGSGIFKFVMAILNVHWTKVHTGGLTDLLNQIESGKFEENTKRIERILLEET